MTTTKPPEPKGLPLLGQLLDMRADALGVLMNTMTEHGGLARLKLGPRTIFLVTHPDYVHELLHQKQTSLTKKTSGMAQLSLLVGNGLLTSDGEFWKRQRRIAQPAFHRRRLAGFLTTMREVAEETATEWAAAAAEGRPLDVNREMLSSTLRIVSRTLLSTDLSRDAAAVADALDFLLVEIRRRMVNPLALPLAVPTPTNVKFRRAVATIDELMEGLIEERVSGRVKKEDLLQMFVDAVDEETGERMDPQQLRDEVVTTFVAGHETTASALAWAFYLLSLHPDVRRRLGEHLDSVVGDRDLALEDLPRLTYLEQVINETMRLYPPGWLIARQTAEPLEIGGYAIPEDHTVLIGIYAIHRSPAFWENPLGFDPDRFTKERASAYHRQQFMPFGTATRMCIGRSFAMMEMKVILATLCARFRLDLVPEHKVAPHPAVTLRPEDGIIVTVHAAK